MHLDTEVELVATPFGLEAYITNELADYGFGADGYNNVKDAKYGDYKNGDDMTAWMTNGTLIIDKYEEEEMDDEVKTYIFKSTFLL